ncbi:MAG TPA: hypothetical protein VGX48_15125 [Pyrinomonadaceae bacterium]|nr:hypothetical protein [Pyrinomonadaceae bacterium]
MRKLLTACVAGFVFACAFAAPASAQQRVVGEVTAVDAATGQVTVKTDAGESVTVPTDARTEYFRIQPGQTSLEGAEKLTRADLRVGDRVVARGTAGQAARQLIVTTRAAASSSAGAGGPQDGRRRLVGRIVALDAAKKTLNVQTFGREGVETVALAAGEGVRVLRFAPDSLRPSDARPATFADLNVGDQLRASGQRTAEGAGFVPEEIIAGTFTRLAGAVTAVAPDRNEFTLKDEATGQTFTVAAGKNTMLRRATPEFVEALERRGQRRGGGGGRRDDPEAQARREERRRQREQQGGARPEGAERGAGREGEGGRRGGMRGPQQMFESLPVVAVADLKKGDTVLVTATPGSDAARVTAVALVAGDSEFLRRLQRNNADPRNMSPGLPGDVIGGGAGGGRQDPPGNP